MNESFKHIGVFHVWDCPDHVSTEELRRLARKGMDRLYPYLGPPVERKNLLMAVHKLAMANLIYPTIDHLVISQDTSTPRDTESSYTAWYETTDAEEFYRSGDTNPYQVAWNITSASANGTWGSFILVDQYGTMINRALAGVTKSANNRKIVQFTGKVT